MAKKIIKSLPTLRSGVPELSELPALDDLPISECIKDFIKPKNLYNYFADSPRASLYNDPYKDLIKLFMLNPAFAASMIIGKGDFELLPFQGVILNKLWDTPFVILLLSRGGSKTTLIGLYALMKALLDQTSSWGHRIVIVSASFRQSKNVMSVVEALVNRSPIIKACFGKFKGIKKSNDMWELKLGNALIVALPMGDGEKIRGQRASIIICDEFAAVPEDVFSVVVRGFAAVASNPVENVKLMLARKRIERAGGDPSSLVTARKNQIIRSGTGNYQFNHFYKIYVQYKRIIDGKIKGNSKNKKVREIFGENMDAGSYIDHKDFCIFQMPYNVLPDGYMDMSVINEGRLSMTDQEFAMEYGAEFVSDSGSFFKASQLDCATPAIGTSLAFNVELKGDGKGVYVMGVDPARQRDDFALIICKLEGKYLKIVYAKKWNKRNYGEISFAIRKLVNKFGVQRLGIDAGGGGLAVLDFLQTKELVPKDDLPYFEIDDKDKGKNGLYIVDMVNYMGRWIAEANYQMKAEIVHQQLLFPSTVDESIFGGAEEEGAEVIDTIKELKSQLVKIEKTVIGKTQVEHFDLPKELQSSAKKDLYSALLIAAHEARVIKLGSFDRKYADFAIGGSLLEFI